MSVYIIPFSVETKAFKEKIMTYPVVIVFTPFAIIMTVGFIVCAALLGAWARSVTISPPPLLVSDPQRVGKLPGVFNLRSIRISLRAVQ